MNFPQLETRSSTLAETSCKLNPSANCVVRTGELQLNALSARTNCHCQAALMVEHCQTADWDSREKLWPHTKCIQNIPALHIGACTETQNYINLRWYYFWKPSNIFHKLFFTSWPLRCILLHAQILPWALSNKILESQRKTQNTRSPFNTALIILFRNIYPWHCKCQQPAQNLLQAATTLHSGLMFM